MEDMEQVNSDVSPEVSSEPQETPAQETEAPQQQSAEAQQQKPEDKPQPFHEHPRWKELMEERNKEREYARQLEGRLKEFETRFEQTQRQAKGPSEREQLLERLKGIDPAFAAFQEEMLTKTSELDNIKRELEQYRNATVQQQYQAGLEKLHGEFKVAKELQPLYDKQIRAEALANPRLGIQDLPAVYKQIHDSLSQTIEAIKRADKAAYVANKKSDSAVPPPAKGAAPKQAQAPQKKYSGDEFERRNQLVKDILAETAKSRKAGSL